MNDRLIDKLRRNKVVPTPDVVPVVNKDKPAKKNLRDWLSSRLDKRIELAGERKWLWISVAILALVVMCNSAFNIILSAIGLVLKGIGSVIAGIGAVISSVFQLVADKIYPPKE
jgi:hypothetical protein